MNLLIFSFYFLFVFFFPFFLSSFCSFISSYFNYLIPYFYLLKNQSQKLFTVPLTTIEYE